MLMPACETPRAQCGQPLACRSAAPPETLHPSIAPNFSPAFFDHLHIVGGSLREVPTANLRSCDVCCRSRCHPSQSFPSPAACCAGLQCVAPADSRAPHRLPVAWSTRPPFLCLSPRRRRRAIRCTTWEPTRHRLHAHHATCLIVCVPSSASHRPNLNQEELAVYFCHRRLSRPSAVKPSS